MIACLDACVLYPTVLREVLLGVARVGLFTPIWSDRILEEWVRAAGKKGPAEAALARGEVAMVRAEWPKAAMPGAEAADLWLPDPADIHVLASARAAGAEVIVTLNLRDFPARELTGHGIAAEHPDAFLYALWLADPAALWGVVGAVLAQAQALSGRDIELRGLLKRARLPRLAKALA
ncbi:MAG: PIN domain-containing protein [Pseudomonadota bacterium]